MEPVKEKLGVIRVNCKPPLDQRSDLTELGLADPDPTPLLQKDSALLHPDLKRPGRAPLPRRVVDSSSPPLEHKPPGIAPEIAPRIAPAIQSTAPPPRDLEHPMVTAAAHYYRSRITKETEPFPAYLIKNPVGLFSLRRNIKAIHDIYYNGMRTLYHYQRWGMADQRAYANMQIDLYTEGAWIEAYDDWQRQGLKGIASNASRDANIIHWLFETPGQYPPTSAAEPANDRQDTPQDVGQEPGAEDNGIDDIAAVARAALYLATAHSEANRSEASGIVEAFDNNTIISGASCDKNTPIPETPRTDD